MTGGKEIVYNGTAYEESINRVLRLEGLQRDAHERIKQKQKEKEIEPDTVDLDNIEEVVQANEVVNVPDYRYELPYLKPHQRSNNKMSIHNNE